MLKEILVTLCLLLYYAVGHNDSSKVRSQDVDAIVNEAFNDYYILWMYQVSDVASHRSRSHYLCYMHMRKLTIVSMVW